MKRIVLFLLSTATILVLLFGYHTSTSSRAAGGTTSIVAPVQVGGTGAAAPGTSTGTTPTGTTPTGTTPTGASAGGSASVTTPAAGAASSGSTTVLGDSTDTRWGPVQVSITVQDGKITAVSVPVYPDGNGRDQEINATALPTLVQETITAQNANIDMVSGATVTSEGYVTSLQSALDKAGL